MGPGLLFVFGFGVVAVLGPGHLVAGGAQQLARDLPHVLLVVDDEAAIADRAAAYHAQEKLYARAVERAFGLDRPPATELWFLWPDRLWTVP